MSIEVAETFDAEAAREARIARVQVVKDHLTDPGRLGLDGLHKTGSGWMARCVWHRERTPSMSIRLVDGVLLAKCFGCGNAGSVIDLVAGSTHARGKSFVQALETAEALAGIVPGVTQAKPRAEKRTPYPVKPTPPADELHELWRRCRPVTTDPQADGWLRSRALDPEQVEERDLARVLPPDGRVPRWAWSPEGAWTTSGHRLIVPTYDATGAMASCQARILGAGKALSPAKHRQSGVFADALGRLLLETGAAPEWCDELAVEITEGIPDFLTLGTMFATDESAPAVFGVIQGAWTDEIAARVPDGARITIWQHGDQNGAGEKYTNSILQTFKGRRVDVRVVEGMGR